MLRNTAISEATSRTSSDGHSIMIHTNLLQAARIANPDAMGSLERSTMRVPFNIFENDLRSDTDRSEDAFVPNNHSRASLQPVATLPMENRFDRNSISL